MIKSVVLTPITTHRAWWLKIVVALISASIVYFIYRSFFTPVAQVVFNSTKQGAGAVTAVVVSAALESESTRHRLSFSDASAIALGAGAAIMGVLAYLAKKKIFTGQSPDAIAALSDATKLQESLVKGGFGELAIATKEAGFLASNLLNGSALSSTQRTSIKEASAALRDTKSSIADNVENVKALHKTIEDAVSDNSKLSPAETDEYVGKLDGLQKRLNNEKIMEGGTTDEAVETVEANTDEEAAHAEGGEVLV